MWPIKPTPKNLKNSSSLVALWGIILLLVVLFFTERRFQRTPVLEQDIVQYYAYLPAVFIYGDIHMKYAEGNGFFADKVWGERGPAPKYGYIQKYTMGMAVMYSPFFLMAHLTASITEAPADGYSLPYKFFIQFAAIFFVAIGLIMLRMLLRIHFSDPVTAITLLLVALGTNLFFYTMGPGPMPHAFLFCLVIMFLLMTHMFYDKPSWKNAMMVGMIGGLVVLIRPNHILLWMIPIFYGLDSREAVRERIQFIRKHFIKFMVWPAMVMMIVFPQLLYWKTVAGQWIYYSYTDEGFFFGDPKFGQVLFGFRKGWFIYTPVMLFATLGFFWLRRFAPKSLAPIGITMIISTYVIASWWCWWYGGTFGARIFIDYYGLMALPLAALITTIRMKWPKRKQLIGGVAALLIFFNLFQTWQHNRGIIHWDSMTPKAWLSSLFRTNKTAEYQALWKAPDYEAAKRGER